MNFTVVFITCPGRESSMEATRASLVKTDLWKGSVPAVLEILDANTCERRQERQERNSLLALQRALETYPDVIVFCEDDIIFNRHLRWNLENWKPLRNYCGPRRAMAPGMPEPSAKTYFFGSLYDPNIRELSANPGEHFFIADPNAVYGSQCFVLSRALAEYCVEHWWEVQGMQDIKLSRLAARLCPLHYHTPCLVQHVGVKSTWTDDNRFHDTKMFDANFRAEELKF